MGTWWEYDTLDSKKNPNTTNPTSANEPRCRGSTTYLLILSFYSHQHTHLKPLVPSPEIAPRPLSLIGPTRYQRLSNLLTEIISLLLVTKAFLTTQQARCTLTSAPVIPIPSIRQLKGFLLRGTEGIDFAVNIKIKTLDFGTFHVRLSSFQSNTGPNSWLLNSSYTPFVIHYWCDSFPLTP